MPIFYTKSLQNRTHLTSSFLFLGRLSSPPSVSDSPFLFPLGSFLSFGLCFCMYSAMRSGQSRLSSGSHVLSSLRKREYILNHLTDFNTIFFIGEGLNHQPKLKAIYLLANHLFSQKSLYNDKMTNKFFLEIKLLALHECI